MKKSKFLLTLLMVALFVGFSSCSDDDDIISIEVEKSVVDLEVGEKSVVKITEGNGGYTVVSADEETATAIVKDNEVLISGIKEGTTTITITDKEGETMPITVNVVTIVGEWNVSKIAVDAEVEDKDIEEEIKAELANDGTKSIALTADGKFTIKGVEDGKEYTVEGTYTYVDKILTLGMGEGEEVDADSYVVTELTKTTLKYQEDRTESVQEDYPEAGVTKATVFYELEIIKD